MRVVNDVELSLSCRSELRESTKSVNDTEYHPKCSKVKNKSSTRHRRSARRIRKRASQPTTRVIGHRRVHANATRHVNRHGSYENIMLAASCRATTPLGGTRTRQLWRLAAHSHEPTAALTTQVYRDAPFPLHFPLHSPFLPYPRGGPQLSCDECWPIAREALRSAFDYRKSRMGMRRALFFTPWRIHRIDGKSYREFLSSYEFSCRENFPPWCNNELYIRDLLFGRTFKLVNCVRLEMEKFSRLPSPMY